MRSLPEDREWFRVGEVATWLGVGKHVLRFWEDEFGSLIGPVTRSKTRQRYYSRRNAVVFSIIYELLYVELYTIKGAKRQLRLAREAKPEAA